MFEIIHNMGYNISRNYYFANKDLNVYFMEVENERNVVWI